MLRLERKSLRQLNSCHFPLKGTAPQMRLKVDHLTGRTIKRQEWLGGFVFWEQKPNLLGAKEEGFNLEESICAWKHPKGTIAAWQ